MRSPFKIIISLICLLTSSLCLSVEQTYLLLQSESETGLLTIKDKIYTPLFKKTNYIQASGNGKIVYQASENSPWQCAKISLSKDKPELVQIDVPADLTGKDCFAALSADGNKLFWAKYGDVKSTLFIWDCSAKKIVLSKEIPGYVYLPVWSPNTKKLAFYLKEKSPNFLKDDYGFAVWDTVKNEIQHFPVSMPTRPSPQRDWKPMWSNNSQYVFYEGRYDFSKNHFEALVDTVSGKLHACGAGLWVNDSDLLYLPPSSDDHLIIYLNPLEDVLKGKLNLKNSIGKVNAMSFQAVTFDSQNNTLYFQPSNRIVSAYYLNEKKEEALRKVDFNIREMTVIRK